MKRSSGPVLSPNPQPVNPASRAPWVALVLALTCIAGPVEALQVLDPEGRPVADARVKIYKGPHAGGLFHELAPPVVDTETDPEGRISATLPVLQSMLLLVDHPSHAPWVRELSGAPPDSVVLQTGLELRGRVDLGGEAVRDGQACAGWSTTWIGGKEVHEWRRCTAVSEDGRLVLPGLGNDEIQLAVWVPGFVPHRRSLRPGLVESLEVRPEPGHRLIGRVESQQQPIRGAIIRSLEGAKESTAGDGTFEITVATLPTQLTVEAPGFHRRTVSSGRTSEPTAHPAADDPNGLVIELEPAEQISGAVLDFDGLPLERATIRAIHHADNHRRSETRHPVETEDGGFWFDLPRPGRYQILAEAEGRRTELLPEIYLAPGQIQDLGVVTLSRGAGVVGTLVNGSTDEPIPGAIARIVPQGTRIFETLRRGDAPSGVADETGQFEIWGLETGRYDLRVEHKGYAPTSLPVEIEQDKVADLDVIALDRGTKVSGILLDREGRVRSGLQVRVLDAEQASLEPFAESFSDPEGRFGGIHLASGYYRFNVHGKRLLLTQEIELPADEPTRHLELTVGGVELFGRVTRGGDPVDGGFLSMSAALDPAASQGKILLRTETGQLTQGLETSTMIADVGPEGTFYLADAPHGALSVTYYPPNGEPVRRQVLVPDQPRHELALEIGGFVLRGRVVDSESGLGVESASFRLVNEFGWSIGTVTTDASGHFEIADLESGTYAAEIEAPEFASAVRKPVIVQSNMPPIEVPLEPKGAGTLSIRLVRQDGSPVAGILVSLLNENGRMVRSLLSDNQGLRRYEGLPAGHYFVVWADPLSGTGVSEPVSVRGSEETHFERILPDGGTVKVACDGCGGASVEHVAVFSPQGVDIGAYLSGVAPALRFSNDGQLALGRLSRNTYLLRVWTGSRTREAIFTVDADLETVQLP